LLDILAKDMMPKKMVGINKIISALSICTKFDCPY
jgi:hypothetical protein